MSRTRNVLLFKSHFQIVTMSCKFYLINISCIQSLYSICCCYFGSDPHFSLPFLPRVPLFAVMAACGLLFCFVQSLKSFNCLLTATGSSLNSLGCHESPSLICPPWFQSPFLNSLWILFVTNWLSRVWLLDTSLKSLGRQPTLLDHIIFGRDFFSVSNKALGPKQW